MPLMIKYGNELIRICPSNNRKLEYSTNGGKTWFVRCPQAACGEFYDLMDNGRELLATTAKGLFYSKDGGKLWFRRG